MNNLLLIVQNSGKQIQIQQFHSENYLNPKYPFEFMFDPTLNHSIIL
jgi:hypothetical protein